jgi:undecaprenyl-diphosphatase
MTLAQAVISGMIQGITEFFPISSSGHLVILHHFFGLKEVMLTFDVFLHFATLVSVIIFFRKDIIAMFGSDRAMLKFIVLGCIPTFIIGILFKDAVESMFTSVKGVGVSFIITGVFLIIASIVARYREKTHKARPLNILNSILIGIAQGIAIIPGISRSGATIGTALVSGIKGETALKFSFLLSLPVVLGVNLLKAKQIYGNLVSMDPIPFLAGGIVAMVTGLIAIKALFGILRKNLFYLFGIYCLVAGFLVLISGK